MAELKTQKTRASVKKFIDGIEDDRKRKDARTVLAMMKRITKARPAMWGTSMIGFGSYTYKYASGREGDWFLTGFSPRKQALTLYIMSGLSRSDALLKKLGKFKTGKGCLYIKKLEDVDTAILEELIRRSVERKSGGQ